MNNGKVAWGGNYPAVVTPFTRDGAIDEAGFCAVVELMLDEGADGVVVSGSNGESWALRGEERLRLFRLAGEVAAGRGVVIGGTGSVLTPDVIELTERAKETGIDGVMVMPPYYAPVGAREVVEHFRAISDATRFPILVYNTPKATQAVTPAVCEQLAEIEWVVGIKQSCLDFVEFEETVARCGERLLVFTGHSGKRGMAATVAGAVGFVSSFDPHVLGREGISLWRLSSTGDLEAARRVQMRTLAVDRALGPIGPGPAVMKAAMNLLGRPGGHPRRPLLALSAEQTTRLRGALEHLGLSTHARDAA